MIMVSAALHHSNYKSQVPARNMEQMRNVAYAASMTWNVHPCRSAAAVVLMENTAHNL
jgi:hypothetical protein